MGKKISLIFFIYLITISLSPSKASGQNIDALKNAISDKSSVIQQLEKEITQYQQNIQKTQAEANSLSKEIKIIDTTRQKLLTDLKVTENKIDRSNYSIAELGQEISSNKSLIDAQREAIAASLRDINIKDDDSLMEILLSHNSLSEFLSDSDNLRRLQKNLKGSIDGMREAIVQMEDQQTAIAAEVSNLTNLQNQLSDQKTLVEQNKKQKDQLLSQTKNKEATYQAQLAEKLARKQQVEDEIRKIEEQIKITLDPSALPSTGKGVLSWPLDKVIITQYFGNTSFATQNPQVYNGRGHNGIDLGIPVGSTLRSAADGRVVSTGDTDVTCKGASYGKWILIQHNNGLTTLYAHLSLIKVSANQTVTRGEVIGYTGNTGYSTGPHLHFTVYASQGVKIGSLKSSVPGCGTYTLPLASPDSYLNPLSYL